MKTKILSIAVLLVTACLTPVCPAQDAPGKRLKVHSIFASNVVLQRDKPIVVWGWATPGKSVSVQLGKDKAEVKAAGDKGRWEVTFPAREASAKPQTMVVTAGDEKVEMTNIVVGDVWVMTGQSNMAFQLTGKVAGAALEAAQADLPLLRFFSIKPNEQAKLQEDIPAEKIETKGWAVSNPDSAREFSAIGYVFGSLLQRSLGIPIGVIKSARGGASIEAIVPCHKFDDHPLAKRYAESVRRRMAEFDPRAKALEVWQNQVNRAKAKGKPEAEWPKKPLGSENLTSWNIPGMTPSDMGSVDNGMVGVFKGYNIKGVLFHQGYNNAISSNCRPKLYRVLMKLMVEGWREDFNDPDLPVGVIEFCAGGNAQNEDNFEVEARAAGPYIREAQRLGLADVANQKNLVFLPGYDVQVPGLHPSKKREHGERAACWALATVYPETKMEWRDVKLLSAEPKGDEFIFKFDGSIIADTRSSIPEGFSIAGADGKFYMAHARYSDEQGHPSSFPNTIHVWSPLVKAPVAVRYAWATSPMGNLTHRGTQDRPFPSFRTDTWDWPESEDPEVSLVGRAENKEMEREATERLDYRRTEEAKRGVEILERVKTLGRVDK
jgi:sialate O-acetylesterase